MPNSSLKTKMHAKRTSLGLMSGTSMDGVDAAILITDGTIIYEHGPTHERPYTASERKLIAEAIADPENPGEAEAMITSVHIEAVRALLEKSAMKPADIDVIGFHGQTISHRPDDGQTIQIGDGAKMARELGIDVVDQFRIDDVAAGGQGAPFAPLYHRALIIESGLAPPVAVLNLGGVANITWIGKDDKILAFDTGPANALIDDWAKIHTGQAMDKDGRLARAGAVNEKALAAMLDESFYQQTPPKSLDRNDFSLSPISKLTPQDGAATLIALTAGTVRKSIDHLPETPEKWIICGGGRHNPALMDELANRLPGKVMSAGEIGWRGDALEAEAFAYLAVRSLEGLPLSLPETTGVPHPLTGGRFHSLSARP